MAQVKKRKLTKNEREGASKLWPLLAWAASKSQILTYGEVEKLTGIYCQNLGFPLGGIRDFCKKKKIPYLNNIVVNQDTGEPGEGAGTRNWKPGEEQMEVKFYGEKWLKISAPQPDDFKQFLLEYP